MQKFVSLIEINPVSRFIKEMWPAYLSIAKELRKILSMEFVNGL